MIELIQKVTELFNIVAAWFNNSLGQGVLGFTKSILMLIIDIFEFFIYAIRWIIERI